MKGIKPWYLVLSALFYFTTTFYGIELLSYLIFYALPLGYICLNFKYFKKIISICLVSKMKYFSILLGVFIIFSITIPVLHQTFDFSFFSHRILYFFKESLRVVFLIIVFLKHISTEGDWRLFVKYYLLSCCCYIAFTIVLLLFPDFKMIMYDLIKESEHSKNVALQADYITRYGWSGFSGFEYTLKCTWGVCLSLFLILENIKKKNIGLYIICAVMLVGNMFYGRSGLLVSLIIVSVFALILLRKKTKIFATLLIIIVIAGVVLIFLSLKSEKINSWFSWAFAIFINFFNTGELGTTSTDILINQMIFLPPFKTIMLGDGFYMVGSLYYMNTDVGFMRLILFGGLPFLVLEYGVMIALIYSLISKLGKLIARKSMKYFMILVFTIVFIPFELKGEIVFASISILFGISVLVNYNNKNKE